MFRVRALFTLEPGHRSPGIFAGAQHRDAGAGRGAGAYSGGAAHLPPGSTGRPSLANLSTAFAFSYCISMVLFIVCMKLPESARGGHARRRGARSRHQPSAGAAPLPGSADEFFGGPLPVAMRTYEIKDPEAFGQRLGELRRTYPFVAIERILRGGQLLDPSRRPGAAAARHRRALRSDVAARSPPPASSAPRSTRPRCATPASRRWTWSCSNKESIGQTLVELAREQRARPVPERDVPGRRTDPVGPDTVVQQGRRPARHRQRAGGSSILEKELGRVVRSSLSTDIVTLALGLALGALHRDDHDPARRRQARRSARRSASCWSGIGLSDAAHAQPGAAAVPIPSRRGSSSRTSGSTSSSRSSASTPAPACSRRSRRAR